MKSQRFNSWPVIFLALFTGAMGILDFFSAILPPFQARLALIRVIFPFEVRAGSRLATAVSGFALLILASGIARRKQAAWLITLWILVFSIFFHLVKGLDFEEAGFAFALIILMIIFRRRFYARSDRMTIRRGLIILVAALAFVILYGIAGFYLLDHEFSIKYNLQQALSQTILMLAEYQSPNVLPLTHYGRYFVDSIYIIGIATLGFALFSVLSPVILNRAVDVQEREKAKAIVTAHGRSVLARFCLFNDKNYYFSKGGSLIAYVFKNRTAVVLGDPIGPADDISATILSFTEFCRINDWMPVFYQTRPDFLDYYQSAGLKCLKIGEEAIVHLSGFQLSGGEMKALRASVNKMTRLGFSAKIAEPPHSTQLLDSLNQISDEWMTERKGKEMKFSMGWFDREYLDTTPILLIEDQLGKIIAFANLVSEYQLPELAVDLMRHIHDAPSGTMDFLFVSMFQYAKEKGYQTFNLGLSGMAGVGDSSNDPAIEKAIHFIYRNVNLAYNFRGLHAFKEKFQPEWSPRYLIYPGIQNLPLIAIAVSSVSY